MMQDVKMISASLDLANGVLEVGGYKAQVHPVKEDGDWLVRAGWLPEHLQVFISDDEATKFLLKLCKAPYYEMPAGIEFVDVE